MSELLTLRVLNNILTGKLDYCTLCFTNSHNNLLLLKDEIIAEKINNTQIIELLSQILDRESLDHLLANNVICKSCTISTIKCYEFINMCKENLKRLNKVVVNFSDSLVKSKITIKNHKPIFISVKPADITCDLYWEPKKPVIQNEMLQIKTENVKVKHKNRKKYDFSDYGEDFVQTTKIDSDCEQEEDKHIKNTKNINKKKPQKSKPMPTSQIRFDSNSFKCKICLKEFTGSHNLRQHYFSVHAAKNFKCTKCPRKFGRRSYLVQHMKDFHVPVVCIECGKLYRSQHALKAHETTHKINLTCPLCERIFKHQKRYNEHVNLKKCQSKKPWNVRKDKVICDYCNKEYSSKTILIAHIGFKHGNVKGFACTWCSKRFNSVSGLKAHNLTHTQDKKFSCDVCGGKFQTKISLRYHTRLHTGERPYSCHLCEKSFTSSSRRGDHIKKNHLPRMYECDICHKKFTTTTGLKRHKTRHFNPKGRLIKRTDAMDPLTE